MRPVDADEIIKKQRDLARRTCDEVYANDWHNPVILGMASMYGIVADAPTIDPVKHSGIDHIKSLYFSDGWYVINEWSVCSDCGHSVDDFGQKFCSECGAKLDGEHRFFRKKTTFVEGENALVPISHTEYKCAEDWEYENN